MRLLTWETTPEEPPWTRHHSVTLQASSVPATIANPHANSLAASSTPQLVTSTPPSGAATVTAACPRRRETLATRAREPRLT
ncbi:hypothetical protein [Herbidospora cretacea]|uniref:hypothetical protein n=1 Tax=Herbidospora cretacea TaxID=28444 RepID=UPI0012F9EEF7|nr:hypothetical protein [Herbidospora cretacea]